MLLAALLIGVLAAALLVLATAAAGFVEARRAPIVRRITLALPDWPEGGPPAVVVALLADLHVGTPSTDAGRLARVVEQVDGLHPDLILIAGDVLPGHRPLGEGRIGRLMAPLSGLHARLGVVAVLGNHDYWAGAGKIGPVLQRLGVTVLMNQAVERGPLAIGGADDPVTGHARVETLMSALRRLPGARVVVAHSPELVDELPPDAPLLLAGHTHCGQVRLPLLDPKGLRWRYRRYKCGVVLDPGRTTVVTAGVGTSVVPLRLGAPPDLWLLTLRGADSGRARKRASFQSSSGETQRRRTQPRDSRRRRLAVSGVVELGPRDKPEDDSNGTAAGQTGP